MNNANLRNTTNENRLIQEEHSPSSPRLFENMMETLNLSSSPTADPFNQAEIMNNNLTRYINEYFTYQPDPSLNIPNQYQNYTWFVTPIQAMRQIIRTTNEPQHPTPFGPT